MEDAWESSLAEETLIWIRCLGWQGVRQQMPGMLQLRYMEISVIQRGGTPPHSKTQAQIELSLSAIPRLRESAALLRRFG